MMSVNLNKFNSHFFLVFLSQLEKGSFFMSIFTGKSYKSLLSAMLLGGFVVSVGVNPAYANTDESVVESENEEVIETEEPSLVPGDFFYFLKTIQENLQLAFTFSDEKEAELLNAFVEERILEATALFENGEEELANEILQLAIDQQEEAIAKFNELTDVEATEDSTTEPTPTEEEVRRRKLTEEGNN
jgi:hypothetical protein